jgi:Na+-transporting NADH:ubiquinone oxidoreductase subunit B
MRTAIRGFFDRIHPWFAKGGPFERFNAVYEMFDSFFFTPGEVTRNAPHARDGLDLKRLMTYVVLAASLPAVMGMYNTGLQANLALAELGLESASGWRGALLSALGIGFNPNSLFACVLHGLLYFLPIYVVTMAVGLGCEIIFAAVRNHEVNEGFLVTSMLYTLTLPATTPLWQVALGIAFGVIIGKEVFGGTGKNFLNPALTGRAFLYFAYPAQHSGDAVWVAVDGYSGATALGLAAAQGMDAVTGSGITWTEAFVGTIQGSFGETSTLAIILGAGFLLYTRVASWRIMAGVLLGMVLTSSLFNLLGSATNPMFAMPWYWHLVLGGFAFGTVYMATDPVSAAMTDVGRWVFGALIGVMTILIRVVNPAFPEGVMLAILFANLFAPLIDYFVVQANVKRRVRRHA